MAFLKREHVREKSPIGAASASEPKEQTNLTIAEKTKAEIHSKSGRQKKIIEKNSEPLKPLPKDQLDQFTFSVRSGRHKSSSVCCGTAKRTRLAVRLLPSLLGLSCHPRPRLSQISLSIFFFSLMWFPRLYLHYWSQWIFLQTQQIPINRFWLGAHTVDLVYQGSLLSTLEEVLLVLLGPLTLNAATLLLLLIRWGCQLVFGSSPSFLSKFIMAAAVWTVLDPLAVFAVDAILGRLFYSADEPLADAAKLYWHFFRTEQSGTAGIIITLFLYGVHCILSFTFIYVYFLRYNTLNTQSNTKSKFSWSCSSGKCFASLVKYSHATTNSFVLTFNISTDICSSLIMEPSFPLKAFQN
ncbi:uncharacterized protein ofcc1 [Danio aesculapii]|uniref:uncharacterized protein ofcc1 n=1 Tax=Danio aesculapii TaxID=1142201 RepID=UPI0024BFF544|nr:uncharacterized protein ofcc1 [Danio aesculapii]